MEFKKDTWPDNLRIIATLGMVLLHVTSPILYLFGKTSQTIWHLANGIDSSVRFCVPVFIMLSGALLLGKDYGIREFLKKRLVRVLLPFTFWSILYILYDWLINKNSKSLFIIWNNIAHGAAYHLWYVYMIIGLYLFIPVISKWIKACSEKEIRYFLIIWVLTLIVSHPVLYKHKPNFDLTYFSGFVGYLILGYYLSLQKAIKYWWCNYALALILIGISITIAGTYYYSDSNKKFNSLFYGYLTPNVLLTSSGIFLAVKNFKFRISIFEKLRIFLCKYSFGIYLAHVMVLTELKRLGIDCFYINPLTGIFITTVSCVLISGLAVLIINKLPYGKLVSG